MMDIRVLRYFLAVARERNITRAAESLHIAQPSLSKQIIELEQELGKKLLIRNKRKILLTDEGLLLRKRADEILSLLEKTEKEIINSNTNDIYGIISIGGTPTISILNASSLLRRKYNNIQFYFYIGDEIEVCERLDHGTLDFCILIEPVNSLKYDYISLSDISNFGLLIEKDNPLAKKSFISKEDILNVPLIIHHRDGLQRKIAIWAQTSPEHLNIVATYNVLNGSPVHFVKSKLGYFLTTRDLLASDLDNSTCFIPLDPPLSIHYALVWKRYSVFSEASKQFIHEIKLLN